MPVATTKEKTEEKGQKSTDQIQNLNFWFLSAVLLINDCISQLAKFLVTQMGKESAVRETRVRSLEKIPWRREWLPSPVFFPGESMDRGAWWAACSPWGRKESDTTE